MNKKSIIKKAIKSDGKGGPGKTIKNLGSKISNIGKAAVTGAKKAFSSSLESDKKNMGFNDPASYFSAGVKGTAGGIIGAVKGAQKQSKLQKVLRDSEPLKAARKMPLIKPIKKSSIKPTEAKEPINKMAASKITMDKR